MNVLSLFDGISCAYEAFIRAGIKVDNYYASEIDKYAIQCSMKNHPDIIRLGDVRNVKAVDLPEIDLLIGGSPCQDLSIAGNREGLKGERSGLFYEYLRILNEVNPKWFILENVASMGKSNIEKISVELGCYPNLLDAALVSAQSRKRLFWTNINVTEYPRDRGIFLKDILIDGYTEVEKSLTLTKSYSLSPQDYFSGYGMGKQLVFTKPVQVAKIKKGGQGSRIYSIDGKSITLSKGSGGIGAKTGLYQIKDYVRKLYPIECERLQGLPDNYTEGLSDTRRYEVLGNAFNVDIVAHILSFIPEINPSIPIDKRFIVL